MNALAQAARGVTSGTTRSSVVDPGRLDAFTCWSVRADLATLSAPAGASRAGVTESRGAGVGKGMVMLLWDCGLSDYQWQHGMLLPMAGEAAWLRPEGRKAYFVGAVKTLDHEFSP